MHGTIFAELKSFVDSKFGPAAWGTLLEKAGLGPKLYLPVEAYPDEEVVRIVGAASAVTGAPPSRILEDFGEFVGPHLLTMYRSYMKPEWTTLEVIENTEQTAHRVVRRQYAEAHPPYLQAERTGPRQVTVTYNSARRLCAIAKGMIRGLAAHFGEAITIHETSCMHAGANACVLVLDHSESGSR